MLVSIFGRLDGGFKLRRGFVLIWEGDFLEMGEGILSGEMAVIGLMNFFH